MFTSCFGSEISFFERVANYGSRKSARLDPAGSEFFLLSSIRRDESSSPPFLRFLFVYNERQQQEEQRQQQQQQQKTLHVDLFSGREKNGSWSLSGTDTIQKRLHVISSDRRLTHTRYSVSLSKKNAPPRGPHGQIKNVWYATVLGFLVAQQQPVR